MNGDLLNPDIPVPEELQNNIAITTLDKIYNWSRRSSVWPLMFGLACCAIEMICTAASRYDLARFGMEVMRPSPRQADLMIVSGTVTKKMIPQIVRLYNQMPEPRYVLSMGACANGGGPFKEGYNVVSGVDKFVPVDVYVPGCPPTPQALLHGLIKLQEKIARQSLRTVPWYQKGPSEAVPVPVLGPDLIDPRQIPEIKRKAAEYLAQVAAGVVAAAPATAQAQPEAQPAGQPTAGPAPSAAPAPAAEAPAPRKSQLTPEEIARRQALAAQRRAEREAALKRETKGETKDEGRTTNQYLA